MELKAIVNGKIITPDRIIDNGVVIVDKDRIFESGEKEKVIIPESAEIIDAEGNYIGPGLIDIHCHGGGGYWVHQNPEAVFKAHLKHGTMGFLATIAYIVGTEETIEGIGRILKASKQKSGSICLGIHMEGPYINPKYGASSKTARRPRREEYERIFKAAEDKLKVWTLAPEIDGIDEFIDFVSEKGVIMSVGHSEVQAERLYEIVPKGLRLACHCMNAMGTSSLYTGYRGTREVGVAEAVMCNDDIYAEVIPDSMGCHVRPLMLKLLYKTKGVERIIIISDATEYSGTRQFNYIKKDGREFVENLDDVSIDENGDLAGTNLTMNYSVRNMMNHTGVGLVEAFRMGSLNPATLLGIQKDYGSIDKGKKANILITSEKIEIKKLIFEGQILDSTLLS